MRAETICGNMAAAQDLTSYTSSSTTDERSTFTICDSRSSLDMADNVSDTDTVHERADMGRLRTALSGMHCIYHNSTTCMIHIYDKFHE